MTREIKRFAVVIARAGSNRLKGKNKQPLVGKPLFQWSLEAALEAGIFQQVWISSDDRDILKKSEKIGGVSIDRRPPHLCGPQVRGSEVLEYMINKVNKINNVTEQGEQFGIFCLLQPTSPFRRGGHIREALSLLESPDVDYVVGVSRFDCPPEFALDGGEGLNPRREGYLTRITHTQQLGESLHPAGGIFAGRIEPFLREKHFYGPRSRAYRLDRLSGWDIDTAEDFEMAEALGRVFFNTRENTREV